MTGHAGRVTRTQGRGGGLWQASCACGWVTRTQGRGGGLWQASCACGWVTHYASTPWRITVWDALLDHFTLEDLADALRLEGGDVT
jgi:hypothetical protein